LPPKKRRAFTRMHRALGQHNSQILSSLAAALLAGSNIVQKIRDGVTAPKAKQF
jgi:hypothetical protein